MGMLGGPRVAARIEVVTLPEVTAIVFVVDDDISVRESLELLIESAGWQPKHSAWDSSSSPLPTRIPRRHRDCHRLGPANSGDGVRCQCERPRSMRNDRIPASHSREP